jgi:hypothetical protein
MFVAVTGKEFMTNFALLLPSGTRRVRGMLTAGLGQVRLTTWPPGIATPASVTIPVVDMPPTTLFVLKVNESKAVGAHPCTVMLTGAEVADNPSLSLAVALRV